MIFRPCFSRYYLLKEEDAFVGRPLFLPVVLETAEYLQMTKSNVEVWL